MPQVAGIKYGQNASDSWDRKTYEVKGEATVTYTVIAAENECFVTPDTILRTLGVPYLGAPLSWFPSLYCESREVSEVNTGIWEVVCKFTYGQSDEEPDPDAPWNVKPKWSWSSSTFDDVLFKSYDDGTGIGQEGPIVNSAGTKYPPIARPEVIPVLSLKIPRLDFDDKKEMDYVNTVNESPFWGREKYQALMQDISATQSEKDGTTYWIVTYKIAFKSLKVQLDPDSADLSEVGWRTVLLNEGPEYRTAAFPFGKLKKFKTVEGDAYIGNLDDNGEKADDGKFYWKVFNQFDLKDFDALGDMGPF